MKFIKYNNIIIIFITLEVLVGVFLVVLSLDEPG